MKRVFFILAAVLITGIALGYILGWFFQASRDEEAPAPEFIGETLAEREVSLYFAEPEGRYLARETAIISDCEDDRDCVRALLEQLIIGPRGDNMRVLPTATRIEGVELENDLVRINFSRHLVDHHPGGSMTELLSIYSLINSLSESFPYLRQMQILVEGEVRQTLKGHVRIDHPVYADYTLTEPPRIDEDDNLPTRDEKDYREIERLIDEATKEAN
ncbi:MAG: GerMN domain-containing protein [Pelovirga sp.]